MPVQSKIEDGMDGFYASCNRTPSHLIKYMWPIHIIQRAWRNQFQQRRLSVLCDNYFRESVTIERTRSISFEELVPSLRESKHIDVCKQSLQRVHLLCIFTHGAPAGARLAPENVNIRVFMAAYMIACRPTHVFESMGALEQALLETAIPMLETFEGICRAIRDSQTKCFQGIPSELTKDFAALLFEYLKRFKAWKVPDEAKLTCRIKHALIALYDTRAQLPADTPADTPILLEFNEQIERLRAKLKHIAGGDELARFDVERAEAAARKQAEGETQPVVVWSDGGAAARTMGTESERMTNEQLAHELLLDPTFQLDERGGCGGGCPVFARVRELFHMAFWNSLVDDLRLATPCYTRVLRVLDEIKSAVHDLAHHREGVNIDTVVDIEHIREQLNRNAYGWNDCKGMVASIVEILRRLQLPKRDQEMRTKWARMRAVLDEGDVAEQPRAFCKALEFLLDHVNLLWIDAANARLRLISGVVGDHGVEYEREKFQTKIANGSLTEERTTAWLKEAVVRELAEGRVELQALLDGQAAAFARIHAAAMLSLVTRQTLPAAESMPETLLMDTQRFVGFYREYEFLVLASTMLVTAGTFLAATGLEQDAQLMHVISEQFSSELRREIDVGQTLADLARLLEGSTMGAEARSTVARMLARSGEPTDAVHRVMRARLEEMYRSIVVYDTPSYARLPPAVRPLIARIEKSAANLRRLTARNCEVHVERYNRIIMGAALSVQGAHHTPAAAETAPAPAPASAAVSAAAARVELLVAAASDGRQQQESVLLSVAAAQVASAARAEASAAATAVASAAVEGAREVGSRAESAALVPGASALASGFRAPIRVPLPLVSLALASVGAGALARVALGTTAAAGAGAGAGALVPSPPTSLALVPWAGARALVPSPPASLALVPSPPTSLALVPWAGAGALVPSPPTSLTLVPSPSAAPATSVAATLGAMNHAVMEHVMSRVRALEAWVVRMTTKRRGPYAAIEAAKAREILKEYVTDTMGGDKVAGVVTEAVTGSLEPSGPCWSSPRATRRAERLAQMAQKRERDAAKAKGEGVVVQAAAANSGPAQHKAGTLCLVCGCDGAAKLCGACLRARYCSKACQVAGWAEHKPSCAGLAATTRAGAASGEEPARRKGA